MYTTAIITLLAISASGWALPQDGMTSNTIPGGLVRRACSVELYPEWQCGGEPSKIGSPDTCIVAESPEQNHSYKLVGDCPTLQIRHHQSNNCNDNNPVEEHFSTGCHDVITGNHWGSSRMVYTGDS
jgi:hypothetical protein